MYIKKKHIYFAKSAYICLLQNAIHLIFYMQTMATHAFSSCPSFSLSEAEKMVANLFGIYTKAHNLVGYADQNFYLKDANGTEYILKISNENTEKRGLILQNAVLGFLHGKIEDFSFPAVYVNLAGENISTITDASQTGYYVRLLSWVKGILWENIFPHSAEICQELGQKLAKMVSLLQDFVSPVPEKAEEKWDIIHIMWTLAELEKMKDVENVSLVKHFLQYYTNHIFPHIDLLRNGIIHNDANTFNTLVNYINEKQHVVGLIDFGELMRGKIVSELAIACAYLSMNYENPLAVAAQIIKGFHSVLPLNDFEMQAIFPLMANRVIISVIHSEINHQNGLESQYLYVSEKPGWDLLRKMQHISPVDAYHYFAAVCEA